MSKMRLILMVVWGVVCVSFVSATVETPVTNGLMLALDGSDVTASGGVVSSWNNQAAGAVLSDDFVQNTESNRPAFANNAINGQPALLFDGINDYLIDNTDSAWDWDYDSDTNDAARWTTFVVLQPINNTNKMMVLRSGYDDIEEGAGTRSIANAWSIYLLNGTNYQVHSRSSSASYVAVTKNGIVTTNCKVYAALYNIGTVDPSITAFVNGEDVAHTTGNITRQMNGHRYTRIGANTYGPDYQNYHGYIAEVLVYRRALSRSEISQVSDYLAVKYGVSKLVLHCTMDNADVYRGSTNPPPALSTDDGNWNVTNLAGTGDGTAISTTTGGSVVSSESGIIRNAIRFSDATGGNRHLEFDSSSSLTAGYGSLSVSLWIKCSEQTGTQIVAVHGNVGSANDGWNIYKTGSDLYMRCNSGGVNDNAHKAAVSYSGMEVGKWYHIVLVLDRNGNKLRGYVNGSTNGVVASTSYTDTFTSDAIGSSYNLAFGIRNSLNDYEWKGWMDDIAIWKRALSADEVFDIYNKGLHGLTFTEEIEYGTTIVVR